MEYITEGVPIEVNGSDPHECSQRPCDPQAFAEFEAAHGAVIGELSTTGELIDTHELEVPGPKVVRTNGGLSVTDGPFAETTEWVGG